MDETRLVTGEDRPNTLTNWTGPADKPAWHLVNARSWMFSDHRWWATTPLLAAAVLENTPSGPGGSISTNNRFTHCEVRGNGKTQYGFVHGQFKNGTVVYPEPWEGRDRPNNEHHVYDQCAVYDTTVAAFANMGSQAKEQHWLNCKAGSPAGVGLRMWGGGGTWQGGAMYGFPICFHLGSPADPFTILGGGYESFKQLLVCDGPRQDPYDVALLGLRVMTDQCDPAGTVPLIDFAGPGPLTIIGGQYGNPGQPLPIIQVRSWQKAPCVVNLIGVRFHTLDAFDRHEEIVRYVGDGTLQLNRVGCIYTNQDGAARTI